MTEIDANHLLEVLDRVYEVPEDREELMQIGGLTERMVKAIEGTLEGKSVTQVSLDLSGSKHTQNVYDALDSASERLMKSIILMRVLVNEPDVLQLVLERVVEDERVDIGMDR